MTKMQAYQFLQSHGVGFIANVVLCQHGDAAKKLKAMAALVAKGYTVSLNSFSIDQLMVNGYHVTWPALLAAAKARDLESIASKPCAVCGRLVPEGDCCINAGQGA
jgi:hypothetical protein